MFSDNIKAQAGQSQPQKNILQRIIPMQSESRVLIVLFFLAASLGLSLLINLVLLLNNRALATRESIYVQTPDGFTQKAQEFNVTHREAEAIKQTVVTWMQLTFEWDNSIPGQPDLVDEGFRVGGETVPTKAYLASYLMEEGFRTAFLQRLGQLVPSDVYSGSRKTLVRFFSVSNPRQVGEARWEVDVVSSRIERVNNVEEAEIEFNRTITVQAVPPVDLALADDEPLAWRKRVVELMRNGLMITDVVPLKITQQPASNQPADN